MEFFQVQFGCMLVVLYISFMYLRERRAYKIKKHKRLFEALLIASILSIALNGATTWTVNHLFIIPPVLNRILQLFFLISIDFTVFIMFLYELIILRRKNSVKEKRSLLALPLIISSLIIFAFIGKLEYHHGRISYYIIGISYYTCFAIIIFYHILTLLLYIFSLKKLGHNRLITASTYITASIFVSVLKIINPQLSITSFIPAFAVMAAYINMEAPVFTKLRSYTREMVMGFGILVDSRDENTGDHVQRTTAYVKLLARELRERGFFLDTLTNNYIEDLVMAAPLHDIGKISIPDAILLKPGKLTDAEFEIMKTHAARGSEIIKELFSSMSDDEYERIAYNVARHHHEKWNGKGYPDKLSGTQIPLCARIMAVADVFDAISSRRCYRNAMPPKKCFAIIENGAGKDFDPIVAGTFLEMKDEISALL